MKDHHSSCSVTFLVNTGLTGTIEEIDLRAAEDAIGERFRIGLERHGIADLLQVERIESRRGCIVVTIVLSTGVGVSTVVGLIRDYPRVKAGLREIIEDLNMARLRIGRLGERLVVLFSMDLPELETRRPPPEDIQ